VPVPAETVPAMMRVVVSVLVKSKHTLILLRYIDDADISKMHRGFKG